MAGTKKAGSSELGGMDKATRRSHDRARRQLCDAMTVAMAVLGQISTSAAQHAAVRLQAAMPALDSQIPPPLDLVGAIQEALSVLEQSPLPTAQQAAMGLRAAAGAAGLPFTQP
jgi:hypothetical protein